MPSYWIHVKKVIEAANILIEVLDVRHVEETRNKEIERKISKANKKILYVFNKCDLISQREAEKLKKSLKPSVFISSKDRQGTTLLKKKILELSKGKPVTVGVLGYPNVGKSSLINALAGRGKTRTSSESGHTKGMQKIRVDAKIVLLDAPGVFPKLDQDKTKYGKTGSIDYAKIKDPELVALELIEEYKETLQNHYNIKEDDPELFLEKFAFKFKKISKGNKPNLDLAARLLLKDWQTGKIGL